MKGFGAFRELTEIDLSDVDLVALVGPTGSGKSTIIDAITFALYGTVARYENNRLIAPVINQTSNEARVSLDFELGGQVFTAARIVRRTKAGGATTREARLERAEEVLADDAPSVSKEVEMLLGLDVRQFNRTVVLPQGKFAAFLHDKPGDRQTTLVRLLGMDLYRRIGQAARKRAARAKNQVEALQPEFDSATRELTDERRVALESLIMDLDAALSRFRADIETITALDSELRDLDREIEQRNNQLDRMAGIVAPAGLAELAEEITRAAKARTDAERLRKELSARRRLAKEALESGPDVATVHLGLKSHTEVAHQILEHDAVLNRLDEAARIHESAKRAADRIRERQGELDRCVDQAREAETGARLAHDSAITVAQVDTWSAAHDRYEVAFKEAGDTAEAAQSAEAAIRPLQKVFQGAKCAAAASSERLADLRRRSGVPGLVDLLEVGSDCPLCLQEVHELPEHDPDTGLKEAEADHEAAAAAHAEAKRAYEDAGTESIRRRADASSALKTLRDYESDIASIPPFDQLDPLRIEATKLTEALRIAGNATRRAETAASQHRESATYVDALRTEQVTDQRVTQLEASEELLRTQLTSLQARVAALPNEDELRAQLKEAKCLQDELENADSGLNDADANYERATAELDKVKERHAEATNHLHASRDRVAAFGPPAIDTTDPVAAWADLIGWIQTQTEAAVTERRDAIERRSTKASIRSKIVRALKDRCIDVLDHVRADASVTDLGELLTRDRAAAAKDLEHFERRRDDLRRLRKRIYGLTEQAQVARKLGHLLRTDLFESWLMETALEQLAERATGRLFELSDGQYSLAVNRSDFVVRDHTNADELRSARTLSGGETFLASLSLALAVADAAAELASADAPRMESVFLDEGFGTLDPQTLDTVATAVEELGTTGRFVGVVTHIRDLADRMPVRLEVTKVGGSATVERVEN